MTKGSDSPHYKGDYVLLTFRTEWASDLLDFYYIVNKLLKKCDDFNGNKSDKAGK